MKRNLLICLTILSSICMLLTSCKFDSKSSNSSESWEIATPESQGVDSESIENMLEEIQKQKLDVHQILIIKNGYEIFNSAFYPYDLNHKHSLNSVTKDFVSALVGIAIEENLIKDINTPILEFFPDKKIEAVDDNKKAVTLKHLLTMTSGIDWSETGNYNLPSDSCRQMYASGDELQFVLNQPIVETPGTVFNYSSGSTHLISGILNKVTGKNTSEYAKEKLFTPLGIEDYYWGNDSQNLSVGSSRLLLKAEDLAKLGQVYLDKGKWKGNQVIPTKWVEESTQKHIDTPNGPSGRNGYGYQWWMNPFGGYSGRGYNGQYLFVLPEENMVVVFFGALTGYDFFQPEYLMEKNILPAIKSSSAIAENKKAFENLQLKIEEISKAPTEESVPKLPERLKAVSGKKYDYPNNESISVDFVEGSKEATLHWFCDNSPYDVPIGLDNVYRISDCPNFVINGLTSKVAFRGKWTDEGLFLVDIRALDSSSTYTLSLDYTKEPMERNMMENN